MACRDAYKNKIIKDRKLDDAEIGDGYSVPTLLLGVDSCVRAYEILQNNLTEYEWVEKNKIPPNFWGRNINGKNALTIDEIEFLHSKACKVAAIYNSDGEMITEEQGREEAEKAVSVALELNIPMESAIFLEVDDNKKITRDYIKGFAEKLMEEGFVSGFKANTDAAYMFDREYSRGLQTDKDIFRAILVWATAPTIEEYDNITTTHLIHPDNWVPFAPSGIIRKDIAVWQYGKDCHPIYDNKDNLTTFNLNLIRNRNVIIKRMF